MSSKKTLSLLLIFVGLCTIYLLFSLGIQGGFILDDYPNIVKNSNLHASAVDFKDFLFASYSFEPGGGSRPLAMLSFYVDILRAGLDPAQFKRTNIIIHMMTFSALAYLFYQIINHIYPSNKNAVAAIILAFMWAIHPLHVSSVLYIVQRMQTLGTFFLVLALICYCHMRLLQLQGTKSIRYALLAILFWLLAFASKEDSVLFAAYILCIELTIFHFKAQSIKFSTIIRNFYAVLVVCGLIVYVAYIIPHFWSSETVSGRNYNTVERLLTQGRVLCMYLGQSFFPLPSNMPFFYDDFTISRNLTSPYTTLPSWLFITSLLFLAWCLRYKQPLISLGIFLFFSAHFITSNVIPLEIAFEHRNHFALMGAIFVTYGIFLILSNKWRNEKVSKFFVVGAITLLIIGLSARATTWNSTLSIAKKGAELAPKSERAWAFLGSTYFLESKNNPDNLDRAIITTVKASKKLPESAILANNLIIFKVKQGTVTQADWDEFLRRLKNVNMSVQNKNILWVTLNNAEREKYKNEEAVLATIDTILSKTTLRSDEYLRVAAYLYNQTHQPIKALPLMLKAIEQAPADDPAILKMLDETSQLAPQDWVDQLQLAHRKKIESTKP